MQIEVENIENNNFISSYNKGYVVINDKKFINLIVIDDNNVSQLENKNSIYENPSLRKLLFDTNKLKSKDLILFGTGKNIIDFPHDIKSIFFENSIKYEIMNSISAYKTYNILIQENRNIISIIKIL